MTVPSWVRDVAGVDIDDDAPEIRPRRFRCTELGNAERLVHWHGHDLRYSHEAGSWYAWDGLVWREDPGPSVQARIVDVVRSMVAHEGSLGDDDDDGEDPLPKWAHRSESARSIAATERLARAMLPIELADLDADPWLLPCANGYLDLRTGRLTPARRSAWQTMHTPIEFDDEATCPTWLRFLRWFTCEDDELEHYLHRWAGYCLTGSVREQQLVIFHGDGANGKTTFLEILRDLLGPYAIAAPPRLLVETANEEHATELYALRGRRLALASESKEGRKMNEEKVKRLTGSEAISARRMHRDFITFQPTHKLGVTLNHRPVVSGQDHGIWRRLHLVPCDAALQEHERDDSLPERLRRELPGILAWAVSGCLAWQDGGRLWPTSRMLDAIADYRQDMDLVGLWLEECCDVDATASATNRSLYGAYRDWTIARGELPKSMRTLSQDLDERGFGRWRSGRERGFQGLRVRLA